MFTASLAGARGTAATRRLVASCLLGVIVTAGVVALAAAGGLRHAEQVLFDLRMHWFHHHTPEPSDRIVHIDIDDNALRSVGRWPWPRREMARVIGELNALGAAVIGFDVLFDEPQSPRVVETEDGYQRIDDDALLAETIDRAGNVVLAVNATRRLRVPESAGPAVAALRDNCLLTVGELVERLALPDDAERWLEGNIRQLKRQVTGDKIAGTLNASGGLPDLDTVIAEHFPEIVGPLANLERRMIEEEYSRLTTVARWRTDWPAAHRADDPLVVQPPVTSIDRAAAGRGMVVFDHDSDGVARSVPLWIAHRGTLLPHFALEILARFRARSLADAEPAEGATVLPGFSAGGEAAEPGRNLEIPHLRPRPGERAWQYPHDRVAVVWPSGTRQWEYQFDPDADEPAQHLPIGPLVELAQQREVVHRNAIAGHQHWAWLTEPSVRAFIGIDAETAERYQRIATGLTEATDPEVASQWRDRAAAFGAEMLEFIESSDDFRAFVDQMAAIPLEELGEQERTLREALVGLGDRYRAVRAAIERGETAFKKQAALVSEHYQPVDGAICLIGWTATASIADFVPTALHARAPGVTTHGAVLNALLTDHLLQRAPWTVDLLLTALLGLLATLIAATLAPIRTLMFTAALVALYGLINGWLLFDYGDTVVAAAAPMSAAGTAWIAITVFRLFTEQRERARITRQFKNYVSADLVESLVSRPETIKYGRHELTCLFSDIAGFTTISEQLGPEQTARLLNRALSDATETLMAEQGYVNKYLGDGIMAVFGAPLDNPHHALHACRAALACTRSIDRIREDEQYREMPRLFMRIGLAGGPMMVGDFGAPPLRSDYTVIGDPVNLAARLESANKQFGTRIILASHTAETVKGEMLLRPLGRIVVVGKQTPEPVYELLNRADDATTSERALAEGTATAVAHFQAARFEQSLRDWRGLRGQAGAANGAALIDLYEAACRRYLEQGPPDDFDGVITLTMK